MALLEPGEAANAYKATKPGRSIRTSGRALESTPVPIQKASVEMFRTLRQANLAFLRSLTPAEWNLYGIHDERGAESIRDIAMYYAGHDLNHFKQIEAIRKQHSG